MDIGQVVEVNVVGVEQGVVVVVGLLGGFVVFVDFDVGCCQVGEGD